MDKLPLTSKDVLAKKIVRIHEEFPEAFSEGKIDFERLKMALGGFVDNGRERYGLSWAGKSEAIRNIQTPSVGTLLPVPDESVNFETSENLIIEGDNLEILKLLQKSYHGKIKMIYIDPPYNTGNEFIYPDNFREGLEDYLKYSGQVDDEGIKLSTSTETDGRFHSKWLNMMYPRLYLAKNLLKDDGVIFISIDDHEVHNLRLMMNDIFGEENFIACVSVVNNLKGRSDEKYIATAHESLLMYHKGSFETYGVPMPEEYLSEYTEKDGDGNPYRLQGLRKRGSGSRREDRPNMFYPFYVNEKNGKVSLEKSQDFSVEVLPKLQDGADGRWRWGKDTASKQLDRLMARKVSRRDEWDIFEIDYAFRDGELRTVKPKSIWLESKFSSDAGTRAYKSLMEDVQFDNPKPVGLLKECLIQATRNDDIVLDFFAGSGTLAQAVLELNQEVGGQRSFILVQLPEKTDNETYPSIAGITRERIKRLIEHMKEEGQVQSAPGLGFKFLRLSSSNFKVWDASNAFEGEQSLERQLKLFVTNVNPDRTQMDILYEIILKAGLELTAPIETLRVNGQTVFSVGQGLLLICLEHNMENETVRGIVELNPRSFICLDVAFHGNDNLKTNTQLTMSSRGIEFHTV